MSYIVYGLAQTRITLYAADGVTPNYRITLQKETREGLTLSFKPEGILSPLGSGANWAKIWSQRGFRAQLEIKWDFGLTSSIQAWTGSTWAAATSELTPTSLSRIFTWAFQSPCLVEPHLDKGFAFFAQPDPSKALELKDVKGVAHSGLDLVLVATTVGSIPDWSLL